MDIMRQLEAVLFFKGEPVSYTYLEKTLGIGQDELKNALKSLKNALEGHAIALIETDTHVELRTAPEYAQVIADIRKEELSRDIGKAGIETLSIVLYKGPLSRAEIDYIRGVNSTFILRNLLIRGLVERIPNPNDQRSFVYRPSIELLAHLGVRNVQELSNYSETVAKIESFMQSEVAETSQ